MAFTASAIQVAQEKLESIFASPNTTKTEFLQPAETARALLMRQTSNTTPLKRGDKIYGTEVWFYSPAAAVIDVGDAPSDCDVPTGTVGQTQKVTFNDEILTRAGARAQSNRSTNLMDFADEIAQQTAHMMAVMRKDLNRNVIIPGIAAASQVNLDTLAPAGWDYATNSPRFTVPDSAFTWTNINEFRIIAENNNFGDFFFVSGRLMNDDAWLATLNKMNEGERAAYLAYNQGSNFPYFDTRDLDQAMTRKTLFAIDSNSFIFWNNIRSSSTPTEVDTNVWIWTVADPILRWNDNGTLRPVMYEMEMKKTCASRDSLEFRSDTYDLYGRLIGGFEFAPTGPNNEKGVLQFSNE